MKYVGIFTAFLFIAVVIVAGGNSRQRTATQPSAKEITTPIGEIAAGDLVISKRGSVGVVWHAFNGTVSIHSPDIMIDGARDQNSKLRIRPLTHEATLRACLQTALLATNESSPPAFCSSNRT